MPIETGAVPALPGHGQTVCVTGAGGFVPSWLVKSLLEKGYTVRGTVRNPVDPENDHLRALDGATDHLVLLHADPDNPGSLVAAFAGCDGVFHAASPVTYDPWMIPRATQGVKNVITAAADTGIKRVVFTSSIDTVYMNPYRDPNKPIDESCWSDLDYCKRTENWNCYGKTVAELGAWEVARKRGVDLIVVNPVLVLGPLLLPMVNASTEHVMHYLTGSDQTYVNAAEAYVHVSDVAEAHVRVYEAPAAYGRYICAESTIHRAELCRVLAKLFPEYPVPTKCEDEVNPPVTGYQFTNQRLKDLGMDFEQVLYGIYYTVKSLQEKGMLPVPVPVLPTND